MSSLTRRGFLAAGGMAAAGAVAGCTQTGGPNFPSLSMPTAPALTTPELPALGNPDKRLVDAKVDIGIKQMRNLVPAAEPLIAQAKGILMMPDVTEASMMVGGYYGNGALNIGGANVAYYQMVGGSFGFQAGAQKLAHALLFMTTEGLYRFRQGSGWTAGADLKYALFNNGMTVGAESSSLFAPVYAIVFNQRGLLGSASIDGVKYTRFG
ncbi:YSC84-related protein [Paracoccaceae bacterium GXU_MW_L88]